MQQFDQLEQQSEIEQKGLYEDLTDAEFCSLCKEKYSKEKELKKFKTITFKIGDKGLYSNDLHKIAVIDKHFPFLEEIVPGQPYLIEVVHDTNEKEKRQGVILVKVIKLAQLEDIILNQETSNELVQLDFSTSKKNENHVVSNGLSKITMVDRQALMPIKPRDSVVGRVEEKDTFYIFKPLAKASLWQKFDVGLTSDNHPMVYKKTYNGIIKTKQENIYPNKNNVNGYIEQLNKTDAEFIKEEVRRRMIKDANFEKNEKLFAEALEKATNEAWIYYCKNNVIVEKLNDEKIFKVKVDESWSTVNGNNFTNQQSWTEASDWRELIAESALKIINDDKIFVNQLNLHEKINYKEVDLNNLLPDKKPLGTAKNKQQEVGYYKDFRKIDCQTVSFNSSYMNGELVFEPVLLKYDDIHDSDSGLHKDDSTSDSTFSVVYKLKDTKLSFTNKINDLPEHIGRRFKLIIDDHLNSFKKPMHHFTSYEVAQWQSNYDQIIKSLAKLSLSDRLKAKELLNENDWQVFNERMLYADGDFESLKSKLPVKEYGKTDGQGEVEYFGLPVKVEQAFESKFFPRSGMTTQIPKVGEYNYVFNNYSAEQLSHWLDSHQQYFTKLEKEKEIKPRGEQLSKLECTIREELEKRCKDLGIVFHGYNGNDSTCYFAGDSLNLQVSLSDDFSKLNVIVNNFNNGFSLALKNPQAICDFIKNNNWLITQQVKNVLLNIGVNEEFLNKVLVKPEQKIDKNKEMPFKAL